MYKPKRTSFNFTDEGEKAWQALRRKGFNMGVLVNRLIADYYKEQILMESVMRKLKEDAD